MYRNYIFDLVLHKISIHDEDTNKDFLSVTANFLGEDFEITSSRINTTEFKEGRSIEFKAKSNDLSAELDEKPLSFSIRNGDSIIGETSLEIPRKYLEKIESPEFTSFHHVQEKDIIRNNDIVGSIIIAIQLTYKCSPEKESSCDPKAVDEIGNLPPDCCTDIDPNDVLFVIGDQSENLSNYGKRALNECGTKLCDFKMSLDRYRIVNGKLLKSPEILNILSNDCFDNASNKEISDLDTKYHSSRQHFGQRSSYRNHREKFYNPKAERPLSDLSSSETSCVRCSKGSRLKAGGNTSLTDSYMSKSRNSQTCPVCYTDITWLPKYVSCPKCDYKSVPVIIEDSYNDQLTAADILAEYEATLKKEETKSSRCKCENGKICAYCRIQNIRSNVLKKREEIRKKEDLEDFKNSEKSINLQRVMSELKILYNLSKDNDLDMIPQKDEGCGRLAGGAETRPKKVTKGYCGLKNMSEKEMKNLCRRKRPAKNFYSYSLRKKSRLVTEPHRECYHKEKFVPANMGWLWNVGQEKKGWKPGAISKPVKALMSYFLQDFPADTIPLTKYGPYKQKKCEEQEIFIENENKKPTLHVTKKKGEYLITIRPINKCGDPTVKPVHFKVAKLPKIIQQREVKRRLFNKGFMKCVCGYPVALCSCRPCSEKEDLEYDLAKICQEMGIESLRDELVLSDVTESDSDFDMEFTPPAGLTKTIRNTPKVFSMETQYVPEDCKARPNPNPPPNKYLKNFDCNDRYRDLPDGARKPGGQRCQAK